MCSIRTKCSILVCIYKWLKRNFLQFIVLLAVCALAAAAEEETMKTDEQFFHSYGYPYGYASYGAYPYAAATSFKVAAPAAYPYSAYPNAAYPYGYGFRAAGKFITLYIYIYVTFYVNCNCIIPL